MLQERPRHGYELKTAFEELTSGLWELNIGQVYSTLDRLEKDGLVALADPTGAGPDRKVYLITESGAAELAAWLASPPLKPPPLRSEVHVRLRLLWRRDVAAALEFIATQRRVYHLHMAQLTRQKLALDRSQSSDPLQPNLLLDAALLHTEADLKWLDLCEEKLRRGRS